MKVLATGTAGFIGSMLAHCLHERVDEAVGIDNLNDYCKVQLKQARLARPLSRAGFQFESLDIVERKVMSGFSWPASSMPSCIWRPRRECATRSIA